MLPINSSTGGRGHCLACGPSYILNTMRLVNQQSALSASDLANHLSCPHLTSLELAVATDRLTKMKDEDRSLVAMRERGERHEAGYAGHLREMGRDILEITEHGVSHRGSEKTIEAMRSGADVITQAHLILDRWRGRADFLLKVGRPSDLGDWSYEVHDAKLARETKGGTVLQLSLYSEIVGGIQGVIPERMHVIRPGTDYQPETYRVADYESYYRYAKEKLETAAADPEAGIVTYPEPCAHCDICDWRVRCAGQRREDDHLSLVAGISRLQRTELAGNGIETVEALGAMPLLVPFKPGRGSVEGLERVREQARVQVKGREDGRPYHEVLAVEADRGFCRLPEPTVGDVFFDLEGDPFVGDGGREYLFGWALYSPENRLLDSTRSDDASGEKPSNDVAYRTLWAWTAEEEKAAFEGFIDEMMARWERCSDFHIYHYAPYEPAALKRLMGRYATREEEVDRLLRAGKFVDLYAVTRQSVRASVEKYSIKDLEPFFVFERETDLYEANDQRHALELELEMDNVEGISEEMRETVMSYNRDDCVSTWRLRDWLEGLLSGESSKGASIPRPEAQAGEASEDVTEEEARVAALAERLTEDVPVDVLDRAPEQHARWVLAQVLSFHRREDKAVWWEYFRLRDLTAEEMLDERHAIAGLDLVDDKGRIQKSALHKYGFPPQETSVREGDEIKSSLIEQGKYGEVATIDTAQGTIGIKKTKKTEGIHTKTVFVHEYFNKAVLKASLLRLGEWVADNGVDADGYRRAAKDLLLRNKPRLTLGEGGVRLEGRGGSGSDETRSLVKDGENTLEAADRLVLALDGSLLPVQGPPGSGKTYTGAHMAVTLAREGKRIGVTANSHKVIRNMLDTILKVAVEEGECVHCIQKIGTRDPVVLKDPPLVETKGNDAVLTGLQSGAFRVGAGTAWLWARDEYEEAVDVLLIDEAGQMSLADVIAVSASAKSLVLLGDPQQLEQPLQGSHPDGTGVSALEHLLGDRKTIPPDRGLFLGETWRLHPDITTFTSRLFYDDRLRSRAALDRQELLGNDMLEGAGLRFLPVDHAGCVNTSTEEIDAIVGLVDRLRAMRWRDAECVEHDVGWEEILIVAPYNAQVAALVERMPEARVGTVDRFQGQEAPVVIYSMTTSHPDDAPRGMTFLYNLSRLNVATSRARCAVFLVANPGLLDVDCRTPEQMRLANAFCAYLERAEEVGV